MIMDYGVINEVIIMTEFNNGVKLKKPDVLCHPRYVKPSGLSREEAKKICEKHGVIWGAD